MIVLQESDGTISVAYGSSDPADAETLNDVTLTKDKNGDITSAIGTDANGAKVVLVSVGNFWAAIPVNPDGTFPNADTNGLGYAYPSVTLYGTDPNTGQMNAEMTLNNVYFQAGSNKVSDITSIVGMTSNGASLDLNVGGDWNSNTQGVNLSSLTFEPMGTLSNGQQEWAAMVNGQFYQGVDDQGKAVLQYAQQNNLQVIDFGPAVSSVSSPNLSQYYTLVTNTGVQIIDSSSGQAVTNSSVLSQINQAIGASTPNFGDLSWLTSVLNNPIPTSDTSTTIPAVYIAGPTPIFVMKDSDYQALYASYLAAFGQSNNEGSGGFNSPISSNVQAWVNAINQAMAENGGKIPENMQGMVNFMTQPIPVYDDTGKQTGTTQLAYVNPPGSNLNTGATEVLTLNSSILTNLQTQQNSSSQAGSLIMIAVDND